MVWVFKKELLLNNLKERYWNSDLSWADESDLSKAVIYTNHGLVTEKGLYSISQDWCEQMTDEEYRELLESSKKRKKRKKMK